LHPAFVTQLDTAASNEVITEAQGVSVHIRNFSNVKFADDIHVIEEVMESKNGL